MCLLLIKENLFGKVKSIIYKVIVFINQKLPISNIITMTFQETCVTVHYTFKLLTNVSEKLLNFLRVAKVSTHFGQRIRSNK